MDDSCSSSPKIEPTKSRHSRPSTERNARARGRSVASRAASMTRHLFESSEERSPHQSAIVAVIDSPEWDEDEAVEKEIREAFGEDTERDTEHEEDNGIIRILPSMSEEETPSTTLGVCRTSRLHSIPQVIELLDTNQSISILIHINLIAANVYVNIPSILDGTIDTWQSFRYDYGFRPGPPRTMEKATSRQRRQR